MCATKPGKLAPNVSACTTSSFAHVWIHTCLAAIMIRDVRSRTLSKLHSFTNHTWPTHALTHATTASVASRRGRGSSGSYRQLANLGRRPLLSLHTQEHVSPPAALLLVSNNPTPAQKNTMHSSVTKKVKRQWKLYRVYAPHTSCIKL